MRAHRGAAAAVSAGVFLVSTVVACGETGPTYLTSISGATTQDTPQNAVRGYFNALVGGDLRAAESYVDAADRQAYANAIQSAQTKKYVVQITSFAVTAFDGDSSSGVVGIKVDGQTCLSGKCTAITNTADKSASVPVSFSGGSWYLTQVSLPS
ncbi:MAG TPA: hypothetical protein VF155_10290 [Candidatus Dormibacteraeota bacterium]